MASLDSLQPRGHLVSNGTSSGPVVIDTTLLAVKGSIWLTRPAMIHYATPRAHMLDMARELFGLVEAGKIKSEPSRMLPLRDAAEAHRALESRKTTGATVRVPCARTSPSTPRGRSPPPATCSAAGRPGSPSR